MKIGVIGANGMLGVDLVSILTNLEGMDVVRLVRPYVDITQPETLEEALANLDVVVNCAAYTRVDEAETDRDGAFAVNMNGAMNVAGVCVRHKIRLLHLSTDYVFDGSKPTHYTERDVPNPMNIYGASKLAGEKAIRGMGGNYLIVRVQSLFGAHGPNFVDAIVRQLNQGKTELHVVGDQISCPTYTRHLATAISHLIPLEQTGIVNLSASGECSWFAFAKEIVHAIQSDALIHEVSSQAFPRPATRPPYSVLDNHWYHAWTGQTMPHWKEGLNEYLKEKKWI